MQFLKKIAPVMFFFAVVAQISAQGEKKTAPVEIHFRLNTKKDDGRSYFRWKYDGKHYNDAFDGISGASKAHSTREFRTVLFNSTTKEQQCPKGLRALMLFAVSSFEYVEKDECTVARTGKQLTITFTHRDNKYRIKTDEKGILHVPDGFEIEEKALAEISPEKAETQPAATPAPESAALKIPGNSDLTTENPVDSEAAEVHSFKKDAGSEKTDAEYTGKLRTALSKDGILTISGKIHLTEKITMQNDSESPSEAQE